MVLFKKIVEFFRYWFTRYLLATELYIAEPWEMVVTHIFAGILFAIMWYFNWSVLLSFIDSLRLPAYWNQVSDSL